MDISAARQRVGGARVARLGTVTSTGRPHLVPCCFALVDDVAYTAVDDKPKSTLALRRLEHIRRTPATCLLIDEYDDDWSRLWWVRLDATARIADSESESEMARAMGALTTKYPQYQSVAIPGPVIALEITAWVTWP